LLLIWPSARQQIESENTGHLLPRDGPGPAPNKALLKAVVAVNTLRGAKHSKTIFVREALHRHVVHTATRCAQTLLIVTGPTLLRGTKQGRDLLSPLLFNLILNALLIGLRQSGVGVRTVTGLRANGESLVTNIANCDDSSVRCWMQMMLGTYPVNLYLHRIKKVDPPNLYALQPWSSGNIVSFSEHMSQNPPCQVCCAQSGEASALSEVENKCIQ
jgi:hypothetical protein